MKTTRLSMEEMKSALPRIQKLINELKILPSKIETGKQGALTALSIKLSTFFSDFYEPDTLEFQKYQSYSSLFDYSLGIKMSSISIIHEKIEAAITVLETLEEIFKEKIELIEA